MHYRTAIQSSMLFPSPCFSSCLAAPSLLPTPPSLLHIPTPLSVDVLNEVSSSHLPSTSSSLAIQFPPFSLNSVFLSSAAVTACTPLGLQLLDRYQQKDKLLGTYTRMQDTSVQISYLLTPCTALRLRH